MKRLVIFANWLRKACNHLLSVLAEQSSDHEFLQGLRKGQDDFVVSWSVKTNAQVYAKITGLQNV